MDGGCSRSAHPEENWPLSTKFRSGTNEICGYLDEAAAGPSDDEEVNRAFDYVNE